MRRFIIKAGQAITSPAFSPDSLAPYGRLDVVARSIIAALMTRDSIRRNVALHVVMEGPPNPPLLLTIRGAELGQLLLSEREVGNLMRKALSDEEVEGVTVAKTGFRSLLQKIMKKTGRENIVYLHESGIDYSKADIHEDMVFILGDHLGLDYSSERWLEKQGIMKISIGPRIYFTEQCITFINYLLDHATIIS